MKFPLAVVLGLAALTAGTVVQAQEVHLGVQAHVNLPQGDLKQSVDGRPGLGVGAHLVLDFGGGHRLRPRLDYTAFPSATIHEVENKVGALSLGADYIYMFQGPTGFYGTAGLSADRWKTELDFPGTGSLSATTTRLGYAAGVGFAFNEHLSAELRYTASTYGRPLLSAQNAEALQLGAYYRF